ncbi:MAG: CDP-diacylglycerol--glycerol-3-phosphate 3-phosphatidyltransferase [Bryobacteraceae bacterium]|jgi:CDP-diacylglycerol--glycerol-3-phosphate 3-phosphatidyltransferase
MNLPNLLTLLRIFFVPLLVAALVQGNRSVTVGSAVIANEFLALAIFLAAAATDLLDGFLARRWKQVTTVGMLLDPIADKLLISAALISLVQVSVVPAWIAILIVGREFAVTGLRSIAASAGYTIKASELGKTKMLAQVAAVSLLLLGMHWKVLAPWAMVCVWGVVVFAVVSAVDYFRKFWRKVSDEIKLRRRRELLVLEGARSRERIKARRARRARRRASGKEERP